jgi:hypothetical protein
MRIVFHCFWVAVLSFFLCATPALAAELNFTGQCPSGFKAVLTLEANELVVMKPVQAKLQILSEQGQPVNSSQVYCSLYMPDFATGSNNPKLKPTEEVGTYRGIVFFNHDGAWNVDLTINYPDGTYEEVTLKIDSVLPGES